MELASHTRNPSKDSKYISTSLEYKIAEDYAKAYASRKKESPFILMIYIDKDKDNGLFEKLTPSSTNFNEDKEVTFMHAIFVDRIIGFFSLDADNNFYIFNLNPFLATSLKSGVPNEFIVDQSNFSSKKEELGYYHETWRSDE